MTCAHNIHYTLVPSVFVPRDQRSGNSEERSDRKSENIGLSVELRMCSRKAQYGVLFTERAVGKENITLKENQVAIFSLVLLDKKDVQAVLPKGFEKSLIYQTFAPFADFLTVRNQLNVVIQSIHCNIASECADKRNRTQGVHPESWSCGFGLPRYRGRFC